MEEMGMKEGDEKKNMNKGQKQKNMDEEDDGKNLDGCVWMKKMSKGEGDKCG